jgi:TRAP-type C4-dicarboxylate transport system substrate-binding protein
MSLQQSIVVSRAVALLIAFFAATSALAQSSALTLGPGAPLTISFVGGGTPQLRQNALVAIPFTKTTIPQRSAGRVTVNFSTWSEMNLYGPEIIRLTRQGQVDIADAALTVVAGDVPILDIADLAGLNPTIEDARKVAHAVLPELNKELERLGVRIVAVYPSPAQVFFCNKPITGMNDLKGKRVRTFGPSLSDFVRAAGGQAVSISFGEVYSALERGVIDCAISGTGSGNAAKWYEVSTHLYTLRVGWSTMAYYANVAWWNKLAPDVQRFLAANLADMEEKLWKLGADQTADGIACNTNRAGCNVGTPSKAAPMTEVMPSAEDTARLRKILEDTIIPAWVNRCGARCGEIFSRVVTPVAGVKYQKQ